MQSIGMNEINHRALRTSFLVVWAGYLCVCVLVA